MATCPSCNLLHIPATTAPHCIPCAALAVGISSAAIRALRETQAELTRVVRGVTVEPPEETND